jgi:adenylate cyclase
MGPPDSPAGGDWDAILDQAPYLDRDDARQLVSYLAEQGASREELEDAARTGTLGPLGLELALRPPGERLPFPEAARQAGLEVDDAAALWRAFGFPDPVDPPQRLTTRQVEALQVVAGMSRSLLGPDTTLQLARGIGSAMAQLAEAIVDAFRLQVEVPRQDQGETYSQVAKDYGEMSSVMIPALTAALGEILTGHLLAVARSGWAMDEQRTAVTRDLAIGFADLVDYTRSARAATPAELAAAIGRFESLAGEVVARHGGRVVKLIGDEVMFAAENSEAAARTAFELIDALAQDPQMPLVRVGLAAGPVISHQGDYFGEVVNLAARLVKAAEPGEVLSSQLADGAERIDLPPLKGFDEPVPVYRLAR